EQDGMREVHRSRKQGRLQIGAGYIERQRMIGQFLDAERRRDHSRKQDRRSMEVQRMLPLEIVDRSVQDASVKTGALLFGKLAALPVGKGGRYSVVGLDRSQDLAGWIFHRPQPERRGPPVTADQHEATGLRLEPGPAAFWVAPIMVRCVLCRNTPFAAGAF